MSVLEQFLHHIHSVLALTDKDKVLLAVSGGVDSMTMLHLFGAAGYKPGVAHVNFQLRGEESEGDESFVRDVCTRKGLSFFSTRANTLQYAEEKGVSVQMAAREIRYNFFHEVARRNGYTCIATAHHVDDEVETILLNFARGTGLEGMAGIPTRNGKVIRPILFARKSNIVAYALSQGIEWRKDASNMTTDYPRNLIRLEMIPVLEKLNPGFQETSVHTVKRLKESLIIFQEALTGYCAKIVSRQEGVEVIDLKPLRGHVAAALILWECLKHAGFTYIQAMNMIEPHATGSRFLSTTYEAFVDRGTLRVVRRTNAGAFRMEIAANVREVHGPSAIMRLAVAEVKLPVKNIPERIWVDPGKITFPLLWRNWEPGDRFVPAGMQGHKKVSDFLIDRKVPRDEKSKVTVLESAGELVWVVGYRMDERFAIRDEGKALCLTYEKTQKPMNEDSK